VLVIVDDLDRCQPRYVVELVRGIQTILNSPRVIFLLLGDRDWIEQAFASEHKEMKDVDVGPEHGFGGRFVEKAIQFSFVLPEISKDRRQRYIHDVLGMSEEQNENKPGEQAMETPPLPTEVREKILAIPAFEKREKEAARLAEEYQLDDEGQHQLQVLLSRRAATDESAETYIRHELEALADYLPANPRQMKRIINAVSFLQEVVRLNNPDCRPGSPGWRKLVRWIVLMTEWPRTWVTLTQHPDLAERIEELGKTEDNARRLVSGEGLPNGWNDPITQADIEAWLAPNIPAASGKPWELKSDGENIKNG